MQLGVRSCNWQDDPGAPLPGWHTRVDTGDGTIAPRSQWTVSEASEHLVGVGGDSNGLAPPVGAVVPRRIRRLQVCPRPLPRQFPAVEHDVCVDAGPPPVSHVGYGFRGRSTEQSLSLSAAMRHARLREATRRVRASPTLLCSNPLRKPPSPAINQCHGSRPMRAG